MRSDAAPGQEPLPREADGPARRGLLLGIFPDARFVHIVRDGRAVVDSLMRVDFWKDTWRMREPAWQGGLSAEDHAAIRRADGDPVALAAIQWRAVIERTREEAHRHRPERYVEVRYEDFLQDPVGVLGRIFESADLGPSERVRHFLKTCLQPRPRPETFPRNFDAAQLAMLEKIMGPLLGELGYARAASDGRMRG